MLFRIGFIVVTVLAIAVGLLLGTLNADPVSIDLLWVQLEWPLGLVIIFGFTSGILFGLLLSWIFAILPLRLRLRKSQNRPELPHA